MRERDFAEREFIGQPVLFLVLCGYLEGDVVVVVGLASAQRFVRAAAYRTLADFEKVLSVLSYDANIRIFPAEYDKTRFVAVADKVEPALGFYRKIEVRNLLHKQLGNVRKRIAPVICAGEFKSALQFEPAGRAVRGGLPYGRKTVALVNTFSPKDYF